MSVIVGRALPDVRDGLKPVHRRILYAMYEERPDPRQALQEVGHLRGRRAGQVPPPRRRQRLRRPGPPGPGLLHALSRWWTATATSAPSTAIPRRPTVTPRPAWPSWPTRCCGTSRRTPWTGTPTLTRPGRSPRCFPPGSPTCWSTAPAASPWAWPPTSRPTTCGRSSTPPSACWTTRRPSSADLMEHIKGPDFPTRGIIMGRSGIRAAYATGRGRHRWSGPAHEFEEFGKDRTRIVITEIPYQVNKRMLIKNMADQVEDKRLEGISDIRDESDRNGMRIVIELKTGRQSPGGAQPAVRPDPAADHLCHQHAGPGGGQRQAPAHASSPCGTFWTSTSPSRRRSSSAAPAST